jgi:hypothetical protein
MILRQLVDMPLFPHSRMQTLRVVRLPRNQFGFMFLFDQVWAGDIGI